MKKFFLTASVMILTTAIFYSCKKDTTELMTEEQAVTNLVASSSFVDFTRKFIGDFSALMQYHRSPGILANKNGFLMQVKLADNKEASLTNVYQAFSLDYEKAIALKNKIDNDLLRLLNQNKFLLRFNDDQIQQIIVAAIEKGVYSEKPEWVEAGKQFRIDLKTDWHRNSVQTNGLRSINLSAMAPIELSMDEIWGCVKSALGLGSAGILTISGISKLAKQGIQQVVITASKWVAERAGWFGLAITMIEFGVCIYHESTD